MVAPILTKSWTITPNVRQAYVSLADTVGYVLYQNKAAMVAAGWTVKWTCDGTTGPASDGDNTDRWLSKADADNRGASASAAQSFAVLQNQQGVQVLLAFQGAADHNARISFSPSGSFARAGTVTFQPTASDELVIQPPGDTLVNSTTSGDRVMTIWNTTDTRNWCFALFRANTLLTYVGVERINNLCFQNIFGTTGSNEIPYVGYRFLSGSRATGAGNPLDTWPNVAAGATGMLGFVARVFTGGALRALRAIGIGPNAAFVPGTSITVANAGTFTTDKPALQNGTTSPMWPVYLVGERTANLDGVLGYPFDWWQMLTGTITVPAVGDFIPGWDPGDTPGVTPVRTNWLVSLGPAIVRPWRNAAVSLETT